jgi:hypothetical protein
MSTARLVRAKGACWCRLGTLRDSQRAITRCERTMEMTVRSRIQHRRQLQRRRLGQQIPRQQLQQDLGRLRQRQIMERRQLPNPPHQRVRLPQQPPPSPPAVTVQLKLPKRLGVPQQTRPSLPRFRPTQRQVVIIVAVVRAALGLMMYSLV